MFPPCRCVLTSKFAVSTAEQNRRRGAELSGHPFLAPEYALVSTQVVTSDTGSVSLEPGCRGG